MLCHPYIGSQLIYIQCADHVHFNGINVPFVHFTELLINFRELDYVVNEGDQAGSIVLRFREVQNSFNLTLYPVTITEARDPDGFNVTAFVQPVTEDAQATPGNGAKVLTRKFVGSGKEKCVEVERE